MRAFFQSISKPSSMSPGLEMHDWLRRISGKPSPPCAQEPGKALLVLGSGQIVSALAQAGLLDEYWLFVVSVVLGAEDLCFKTSRRAYDSSR